jgi:hypothetical protein
METDRRRDYVTVWIAFPGRPIGMCNRRLWHAGIKMILAAHKSLTARRSGRNHGRRLAVCLTLRCPRRRFRENHSLYRRTYTTRVTRAASFTTLCTRELHSALQQRDETVFSLGDGPKTWLGSKVKLRTHLVHSVVFRHRSVVVPSSNYD